MSKNTNNRGATGKRTRREQRRAVQSGSHRKRWLLFTGVGVAFVGIVVYMTLWPQASAPAVAAERMVDYPTLGLAAAPVQIVEFGDFGCHSCQAWHRAGILEQVRARYGDQISFTWRDFAVITPQSPKAAEAAQCAHDQGLFWEYHDYLYERAGGLSVPRLKEYAAAVGLDGEAFDACLDSGQYGRVVDAGIQEARRLGLRGTPSFVVNGRPLAAPPSFDMLVNVIETALSQR